MNLLTTLTYNVNTMLTSTAEHAHEHAEGGTFWENFTHIASDPAHWAFELMFSIIFDVVIITLIYGVIIKKFIIPRLTKKIHDEIHEEHGTTHNDKFDK